MILHLLTKFHLKWDHPFKEYICRSKTANRLITKDDITSKYSDIFGDVLHK